MNIFPVPQAWRGYWSQPSIKTGHFSSGGRHGCVTSPSSRGLNTVGKVVCWVKSLISGKAGENLLVKSTCPKIHSYFVISFSWGSRKNVAIYSNKNQWTQLNSTWINLQNIMLSERNKLQNGTGNVIPLILHFKIGQTMFRLSLSIHPPLILNYNWLER